ncbi:unnamed protein product [[Actinomadura] parvosata subsp. kistnae]|uniref:Uncharacterized protein n=1 Tax=[Actinomadura] parvosata subsp. kistnae TaxID=1909395 RepID=A0A1V0AIG7_9ACTN|nr:hypothetical protein [Nonomuraea sp. ATCC 55076]AQZ69983.1 hypothetical protein BKM31_58625 [Nonomuraea sp. ATCC 55076]SPL90317.1 unnamed protein product [Actinomadura parvosata subsp. kistnae]
MTMDSTFLDGPAVPGQEPAVQRICARVAGPGVHVASLPLGGVQVWLDDPGHRWRHYHRMARELRLAGWHTETGPDRLLLLGWSAVCLSHRVRMLGAALTGRLADFDRTAFTAVMVATRLRHEGFPAADLPGEVEAHCAEDLRWPARLADLDGLERCSSLEPLRLRLAQVAGLEAKVGRRCAEHLALASKVARMVAGGAGPARTHAAGEAGPPARARAAGPRAGLTERMVCVSVPNVAESAVTAR